MITQQVVLLWFDVEERYNTTKKSVRLATIRCGLM